MATFEIYRDANREYRWRLSNETGPIAFGGEPFASRAGAEHYVEVVREAVGHARIVDLTGE